MTEYNKSCITLNVKDGIADIVLNRPEAGNAIGFDFVHALDDITLECVERTDIRAVSLSSTGTHFCVGGDIQGMTTGRRGLSLSAYIHRCNGILETSLARLEHMDAPSIAMVHGTVAGGGLSLVAGFDIVVAAGAAKFAAAYASIGYCPDMGGTTMVTRRMGVARARRFYLLHEVLDAATAQQTGLVDTVVPTEDLRNEADRILQRWANGPTKAYGAIRRLMLSAATAPYEAQMECETQELVKLARTEDASGALEAFLAKKQATFNGH